MYEEPFQRFSFIVWAKAVETAITYLTHPTCGLRVDWSYVRVFSWFALQMNHENQTTKSHEPGITKRHKGSADESSISLPLKRLPVSEATLITELKPRCE